jgi:hypothetical protein
MPKFLLEQRHAIMAAADALTMQLIARVPLYQNAAGAVLVPLHPLLDTAELDLLLEARALTLLHVHACTLAQGGRRSWCLWGKHSPCWPLVGTSPMR